MQTVAKNVPNFSSPNTQPTLLNMWVFEGGHPSLPVKQGHRVLSESDEC